MSVSSIQINETRVGYVDVGDRGAPILLLVHGFPLDHTMWQHQIGNLAQHSIRVIAPDLPGFGASELTEKRLEIREFADFLDQFLEAIGVSNPVWFCGLSMGGYIGWQFWKYHAARVRGLIMSNTRAAADDEGVRRARRISSQAVLGTGSEVVAEQMTPKLIAADAGQPIRNKIRSVIAGTHPLTISRGQLSMADRPDATDWLPEIDVPCLFIVGDQDGITTPTEMRGNAALVNGAQFHCVERAGHLTPLESPEAFNERLLRFIRDYDSTPGS